MVQKTDTSVYKFHKRNTLIRKPNEYELAAFFRSLYPGNNIAKDPLILFGHDSAWLAQNARQLWFGYTGKTNEPAVIDSLALDILKTYSDDLKCLVCKMHNIYCSGNMEIFPVWIVHGTDTLKTFGYGSGVARLLVPRKTDGVFGIDADFYGPGKKPVYSRRNFTEAEFRHSFMDYVYDKYLADTSAKVKTYLQYKKRFRRLEKSFTILSAEQKEMLSIDWDGGAPGWHPDLLLSLHPHGVSDKITFEVVFGKYLYTRSFKPLKRQYKKLIKRLEKNPVYRHTIEHDNFTGQIHFVNRRSLSTHSRELFLEDVVLRNGDKKSLKKRLKNAIFFDTHEKVIEENEKWIHTTSSYTHWILFRDGGIIQWNATGNSYRVFEHWNDLSKLPE